MRSVQVTAWAKIASPDELSAFDPRSELPNRKHLKLMTPAVRLGVAAVGRALAGCPGWEAVPPERRAIFVGATPGTGEGDDLEATLQLAEGTDARLDLERLGRDGMALMPPLWLVKGLSNNILGYASAYWDLRGANGNRTEGRLSGLGALADAYWAIAESRADLAVAGGADALSDVEAILGHPAGDGAAFFVFEPGPGFLEVGEAWVRLHRGPCSPRVGVDLGAAEGPVRLAEALAGGAATVRLCDEMGLIGQISLATRA